MLIAMMTGMSSVQTYWIAIPDDDFGRKLLNDMFTLKGIQRISARDAILREIVSNTLAHRDIPMPLSQSLSLRRIVSLRRMGIVHMELAYSIPQRLNPFQKSPHLESLQGDRAC
jgi:ATP-dependent DNA helicase RecG